jgi:hypothetical protein
MPGKYYLLTVFTFIQYTLYSQILEPDLQDLNQWTVVNRIAEPVSENGKKGVRFNEVAGNGLMILKGSDFSNGTVEIDIKGSDKLQQSFVGFAFHVQDPDTYDAVYFRPFNFKSEDEGRRSHAVQYISMPHYDWEKLRNGFPGRYENKIDPAPGGDDWFHVKILVNRKWVSVFVNNEPQAALGVEKLNPNDKGGFALWLGNNSGGSFANLKITKEGE